MYKRLVREIVGYATVLFQEETDLTRTKLMYMYGHDKESLGKVRGFLQSQNSLHLGMMKAVFVAATKPKLCCQKD